MSLQINLELHDMPGKEAQVFRSRTEATPSSLGSCWEGLIDSNLVDKCLDEEVPFLTTITYPLKKALLSRCPFGWDMLVPWRVINVEE